MTDQADQGNDKEPAGLDDVVSRAVETGYKVIEEQIQQGQRVAEQLSQGNIGADMVNGNVSEIFERVLRFYSDMGALWFEMLESVVRNPAASQLFENFTGRSGAKVNGHAVNGAGHPAAAAPVSLPIEIVCARPSGARAALDVHPGADLTEITIQSLGSQQPGAPSIEGVRLIAARPGWPATVQITIPDGQPAGIYTGMLLQASGEPAGTLCLHLPGSEEEHDGES